MTIRRIASLPLLALAIALAGCGSDDAPKANPDGSDPALTSALGEDIMVDPELTAQNQGNAGLRGEGPASAAIPPAPGGADEAAKAKAEAMKLTGGTIQSAPAPTASTAANPLTATPAELASGGKAAGADCAKKAEHSAAWAARLPAAFPVYPRGHVAEAAGTDEGGCRLRVVSYTTAVAPKDVIDFYFTRARAAGFDAEHSSEGSDSVLGGSKASAAYMVYARSQGDGQTEVDIVTNGM